MSEAATNRAGLSVLAGGLAALILLSFAGEIAVVLLGLPIPGPIVGLGAYLLLLALAPRVTDWTLPAARMLTRLLGALIVPAAVGLAAFAAFVADAIGPLAIVIVVSTLVTGLTTALLYAGLRK